MIEKILEALKEGTRATTELLNELLPPYSERYKRLRGFLPPPRKISQAEWEEEQRQREIQKFYSVMNKLKREGFVRKKAKKGRLSVWDITRKGLEKFNLLNQAISSPRPSRFRYETEPDGKVRIVTFDIPERERHKRRWLRAALTSIDFSLLQKSVWVGYSPIPEELLQDLRDKMMISCVHIFEISKTGTLKELRG